MRRSLQQMLESECKAEVALSLPSFRATAHRPFVGPGVLFIEDSRKPHFYLFVQFSDKRDAFTVELAWSMSGVFPESGGYYIPRDWPDIDLRRTDAGASEFRFRLSKLWEKPKYDPWWEFEVGPRLSRSAQLSIVADPALDDAQKCRELVTDAIEKVRRYGMPYIEETRSRLSG